MFLEKLDISRKQLIAIGITTLVFIAALVVLILSMNTSDSYTDLDFLGYKFQAGPSTVIIKSPVEEETTVEINDDTLHELEAMSDNINQAYDKFTGTIRNAMIVVYMIVFLSIIFKKKETHFQGLVKGFLMGASLLLLLFVLNGIFETNSLLISFEHHLGHMLFPM